MLNEDPGSCNSFTRDNLLTRATAYIPDLISNEWYCKKCGITLYDEECPSCGNNKGSHIDNYILSILTALSARDGEEMEVDITPPSEENSTSDEAFVRGLFSPHGNPTTFMTNPTWSPIAKREQLCFCDAPESDMGPYPGSVIEDVLKSRSCKIAPLINLVANIGSKHQIPLNVFHVGLGANTFKEYLCCVITKHIKENWQGHFPEEVPSSFLPVCLENLDIRIGEIECIEPDEEDDTFLCEKFFNQIVIWRSKNSSSPVPLSLFCDAMPQQTAIDHIKKELRKKPSRETASVLTNQSEILICSPTKQKEPQESTYSGNPPISTTGEQSSIVGEGGAPKAGSIDTPAEGHPAVPDSEWFPTSRKDLEKVFELGLVIRAQTECSKVEVLNRAVKAFRQQQQQGEKRVRSASQPPSKNADPPLGKQVKKPRVEVVTNPAPQTQARGRGGYSRKRGFGPRPLIPPVTTRFSSNRALIRNNVRNFFGQRPTRPMYPNLVICMHCGNHCPVIDAPHFFCRNCGNLNPSPY